MGWRKRSSSVMADRCRRTWTPSRRCPGVGRKTANVVLGHALGVPGLPVDRHVLRVSNRLGIAKAATPEDVETQLCASVPREQWTLASDTLILHGRRVCRPRPLCERCAALSCAISPRGGRRAGVSTARPPHTEARQAEGRRVGAVSCSHGRVCRDRRSSGWWTRPC